MTSAKQLRALALVCTLTPSPGDSSSVAQTTKQLAGNAAHLARLLRESPYPG